jgi:DNA polymerase-3 subunit gamma/tau
MRDAQSLLDQAVAFSGEVINDEDLKEILGTIKREILFKFSESILGEKPGDIFLLVENVIEYGYDLRFFYKELIQHFRNLLLVKSVKKAQDLLPLNEEDINDLQEEAKKASHEELLRYLVVLQQGEPGLKFSSHPRIYLEAFLVKLCHFKKIVPLESIIEEIEDIKKGMDNPKKGMDNPSETKFTENTIQKETIRQEKEEPEFHDQKMSEDVPKEIVKQSSKKEREIEDALKDPSVQSFMNMFNARVLSIKPIKRGEEKE